MVGGEHVAIVVDVEHLLSVNEVPFVRLKPPWLSPDH